MAKSLLSPLVFTSAVSIAVAVCLQCAVSLVSNHCFLPLLCLMREFHALYVLQVVSVPRYAVPNSIAWHVLCLAHSTLLQQEALQSTRARIANTMAVRMEIKRKEPKAPRTALKQTARSNKSDEHGGRRDVHLICRRYSSFKDILVKPPLRQPALSPKELTGSIVAIFGRNSSAPIACCVAVKAVGASTVTDAAHTNQIEKCPAQLCQHQHVLAAPCSPFHTPPYC
jgi:hypothetical protein